MNNENDEVLLYFNKNITTDILVSLLANNLTLHKAHFNFDPDNLYFNVGFLDDKKNEVIQVGIVVEKSIPFIRFGIFNNLHWPQWSPGSSQHSQPPEYKWQEGWHHKV